jgi:hypothetical protein
VQCLEQELGDKMVVEVDITKYRVQPFKSYKVCISLADPSSGTFLPRACTHLFSFEEAVPYVPVARQVVVKKEKVVRKAVAKQASEKVISAESELRSALKDTRDFVRDDSATVERVERGPSGREGRAGGKPGQGAGAAGLGLAIALLAPALLVTYSL